MSSKANPYSVMPQRGGAVGNTITGIIIILVVVFIMYYTYNWLLTGDKAYETISILSGSAPMKQSLDPITSGNVTTTTTAASCASAGSVSEKTAAKVMSGGQYSVTFWVYVSDTKGFLTAGAAPLAHLLEISDVSSEYSPLNRRGKTMLFVGLNPKNGGLVVRQSITDGEKIDNSLTSNNSGSYPLSSLISNYNTGTTFTDRDKCDIQNGIEYQRWVLVGVVANGRTLDVYIDGKLARSCVYNSPWFLGNDKGQAKIVLGYGNNNRIAGYFANANYYSWALSPEEMWRTYQGGPGSAFSIWDWIKSYFSVTVDINGKAMNEISPCTACANSS